MTRILINRTCALGDVLCVTPVVRRLRKIHGPGTEIVVRSNYPDVWAGQAQAWTAGIAPPWDRVIDLDLAYERRPRMHVVDAYLEEAFGDDAAVIEADEKSISLRFDNPPSKRPRLVLIHAPATWPNRAFPWMLWVDVAVGLIQRGFEIGILGRSYDVEFLRYIRIAERSGLPKTTTDYRGLSLIENAALIASSACLICADSAMLHLAGATDTPIVGLFTCVRAEYRMPYRHGQLGWRVTPIVPDLDCYGCLADLDPPVTFCGCRRGDLACVNQAKAGQVVEVAVAAMADGG
jgi:ADP-heptose:LPS heptosyltransferase